MPVFLHELQYPIMQGWDSVVIRADVELGAQISFSISWLAVIFRKRRDSTQQVACLQPILEGLDGVQKMSKSLNNYVGICEAPKEMFGKLMSISDDLMARYYDVLFGEQPACDPSDGGKKASSRPE